MIAMQGRIGSWKCWLPALLIACCATGCVERRMVIITEPFGAIIYDEKNEPIGAGPVDKPFVYYGNYRFRIAKDGYETLVVDQRVRAPWYELPGLDFISENMIPWTIRDVRYYRYVLQPAQVVSPEQLIQKATPLREYGKTIGVQLPDPNPPVGTMPTVLGPPARDP